MKVRIGRSSFTNDPSVAEKRLKTAILSGVKEQATYLSKPHIERLGAVLLTVATETAHQLFDVLADKMDGIDGGGLSGLDLGQGADLAGYDWRGSVAWAPLTRDYIRRKVREKGSAADHPFRWSGRMYNYFRQYGVNIVDSRFGGVNLKIDTDGLTNTRLRDPAADIGYADDGTLQKFLLGRLKLSIFPRLDTSMLPGLASNRWTKTLQDAQFESAVFEDLKTEHKLANHAGEHRPFVTPAVQFWILVRIPAAIQQTLKQYLNRTTVKDLRYTGGDL